jgi:hypothetical protein
LEGLTERWPFNDEVMERLEWTDDWLTGQGNSDVFHKMYIEQFHTNELSIYVYDIPDTVWIKSERHGIAHGRLTGVGGD